MGEEDEALRNSNQAADSEFSDQPVDSDVIPSASHDDHWIELEVTDEDGEPAAGQPYWLRLPDGELREGKLDKDGFLRVESIVQGSCEVRFPGVDEAELAAPPRQSPASREEASAWIEIELCDEDGHPVPDQPYGLVTPDGRTRQGRSDKNGFAREEELPPGTCSISLLELDARDVLSVKPS